MERTKGASRGVASASVLVLCVTLLGTGLARSEDIAANRLQITDGTKPTKRKIQVQSKDLGVQFSEADDPGTYGASVHVYSATDDFCAVLPAGASWRNTGTKWAFKDGVTRNQAKIGDGRLRVRIKSGVTYTLADDGSQSAVNVQVQFGTGTRYCMRCSGNIADGPAKFVGKACPVAACDSEPSECPPSPSTTTTSSSTSTSSSSTTSTTYPSFYACTYDGTCNINSLHTCPNGTRCVSCTDGTSGYCTDAGLRICFDDTVCTNSVLHGHCTDIASCFDPNR